MTRRIDPHGPEGLEGPKKSKRKTLDPSLVCFASSACSFYHGGRARSRASITPYTYIYIGFIFPVLMLHVPIFHISCSVPMLHFPCFHFHDSNLDSKVFNFRFWISSLESGILNIGTLFDTTNSKCELCKSYICSGAQKVVGTNIES